MKTGVLTPFRAGSDERAAANGSDRREAPGVGGVADREHLGVDALRVERAEEAGDHAGLREPLREERVAEVGPAHRDLERGPRHAGRERVPRRAAAVGDAPAADPRVGDVRPVAQPGEDRLHVGDLLRAVDPDQPARLPVAARVVGEHGDSARRCPSAWATASPVLARSAAEAVHEDHRRPAAGRRRAVGQRQRRGERRPVGGRDRHVLLGERAGGPGGESAAATAASRKSSTRAAGPVTAAKGSPRL